MQPFDITMSGDAEISENYTSVVSILSGPSRAAAVSTCSAVQVGCTVYATAYHCFKDRQKKYFVLSHLGGVLDIDMSTVEPYLDDPKEQKDHDLARLRVVGGGKGHYAEIRSVKLPGDSAAEISGFGMSDEDGPTGIKREVGVKTTEACADKKNKDWPLLCWTYYAGGSGGSICPGDSGGGLFDTSARLAGVHLRRTADECGGADEPKSRELYKYASWLYDSCKPVAPRKAAKLAGKDRSDETKKLAMEVGDGAELLRVVMNTVDEAGVNYDLEIYEPGEKDPKHKRQEANSWEVFEFEKPRPGVWRAKATRAPSDAKRDFQLVMSYW